MESTSHQFKILMENRLCRQVETHGGLRCGGRLVPHLYPAEIEHSLHQGRPVDKHQVGTKFLMPLRLFHLRPGLLVHQSLRRKAVGIYPVGHVAQEKQILHHQDGLRGQEVRERHLALHVTGQFGHDDDFFLFVARELRLHFKRTDAVHFIAEKVYPVRPFRGE